MVQSPLSRQGFRRRALCALAGVSVLFAGAAGSVGQAAAQAYEGRAINYRAPAKCIPGSLVKVLRRVSARYGPITVNSTWRGRSKNQKVGGRGHSMHLACRAVDFRVHGKSRGLTKFLLSQKEVGGYNRYPSGFYHIDNGPRRTW
jgi:Peptidase M15